MFSCSFPTHILNSYLRPVDHDLDHHLLLVRLTNLSLILTSLAKDMMSEPNIFVVSVLIGRPFGQVIVFFSRQMFVHFRRVGGWAVGKGDGIMREFIGWNISEVILCPIRLLSVSFRHGLPTII